MTPTRAAAYIGVASILAAWLSSAAGVARDAARPPDPAPLRPVERHQLADELRAQTTRLAERLAAAPAPRTPARNPFAFRPRPAAVAVTGVAGSRGAQGAAQALDVPPMPRLQLIGVAETSTPDGPVRTAMIVADGETLLMLGVGESVGNRYRVAAVDPTSVALEDLESGATRRLVLP
jgi:hypothetical protein